MYPTPTLWFEIGAAISLGIAFLWIQADYAVFLYALALGFPDAAYPLGTTVNLRVDDILILLLLVRTVLWIPVPLLRWQKNILMWQGIFLGLSLFSIAVETAQGTPPGGYETAKMAGCCVIFLVLPRTLQSERRLRFFVAGLMCAGIALVVQIHQHLGENSANSAANFQQLKSAASFSTWNPNTTGQAAVLLVFAAGVGGMIFNKTLANRILWPALATGFALVPAMVYVRGTSLSIAAGFILFLGLMRRWTWILVFAAACLCALLYLQTRDPQLTTEATTVNLSTGEGFSNRYDRWGMAIRGIQAEPVLGQGFGQALPYLTLIGSEGLAHNAYLTVWLELGLGGLLLFLVAIFQFVRTGWFLYQSLRAQPQGALILALIFTLALDSIGLSTLYWEKLATIALSLSIALAGVCEGHGLKVAERDICSPGLDRFAEHRRFLSTR